MTRQNVQLAVREGLELVFVERIAGHGAVPVLTRVGGRFSLHATGVGLALLAHAPSEVQEAVIGGALPAYTPFTITDGERLRRELAEVRHRGYAVSDRMVTDDALSVAAPVHGPRGEVVAAVSLVTSAATPTRTPWRRPYVPRRAGSREHSERADFQWLKTLWRRSPGWLDARDIRTARAHRQEPTCRSLTRTPSWPRSSRTRQRLVRRRVGPRGQQQGTSRAHGRRHPDGDLPHGRRSPGRPCRRVLAPARAALDGQAHRRGRGAVPLSRPDVQLGRSLHRDAGAGDDQPQRDGALVPGGRALPLHLGLAGRHDARRPRPDPGHAPDGLAGVGRRRLTIDAPGPTS